MAPSGPPPCYPVGFSPSGVTVADFNGDGKLDLAVVNSATAGSVSVLLNTGAGAFAPQKAYPVGSFPTAIIAGDFTGDHRHHLLVPNVSDKTVSLLTAEPGASVTPSAQPTTAVPATTAPNATATTTGGPPILPIPATHPAGSAGVMPQVVPVGTSVTGTPVPQPTRH